MTFLNKLFRKKEIDPNDIEAVVNAYGELLGQGESILRDISELPLSKEQIKRALSKAIELTPVGDIREHLKSGYVCLGDFQDIAECKRQGLDPLDMMLNEGKKLSSELDSEEDKS